MFTNQRYKRAAVALLLMIGSALLALLHFYKPRGSGLWLETFNNSAHVPVFALVSLVLFVSLGIVRNLRFWTRISIAGAISVLLAILSEAAQIAGPRDASFEDLLADWLGSTGMLMAIIAFSHRAQLERKIRGFWAMASLILFLIALKPLISVSIAYVERNRNLPVLFSFDAHLNKTFLRLQNTSLEIVGQPAENRRIGRLTLGSNQQSALIFHDLWADWSEYSSLVVDLEIQDAAPLEITLRVHDRIHSRGKQPSNDRFNMRYTLQRGSQSIRIPLENIRLAPEDRPMDLTEIHGIVMFTSRNVAGQIFDLREIRLE